MKASMRTHATARLLAPAAMVLLAATVPAMALTETKLTASDAAPVDEFGYDVDIDMTTPARIIVGAPTGGFDAHHAYIFRREGTSWVEEATVLGSEPGFLPHHGRAVAIDNGVAAVGADGAGSDGRGRVFVFRLTDGAWSEEAVLAPSDSAEWEAFGSDIALDANTLMVAARTGIYVFEHRSSGAWLETAKLVPGTGAPDYSASHTVALEEPRAIIGVPYVGRGRAHVFERTAAGWTETAQFDAPGPAGSYSDQFGTSVGITWDFAVVGAPDAIWEGIERAGAAYIYRRFGLSWDLVATLGPDTPHAVNSFGFAAAISGDQAVVTDRSENAGGPGSGAAYYYRWNGADFVPAEPRFSPGDVATFDYFGYSVAFDRTHFVVGARDDTHSGVYNAGSAYVYTGLVSVRPDVPSHIPMLRAALAFVMELCPPEFCCPPQYCDPPPFPEEPVRHFPPRGDPALAAERLDLLALRTMQGLARVLGDERASKELTPVLTEAYDDLVERAALKTTN